MASENTTFGIVGPQTNASISVDVTTANVAIPGHTSDGQQILLYNKGTNDIFFATGNTSGIAATTSNIPMAAGSQQTFTIPPDHNYIAAIAGAAGNTLYVVRGRGI